MSKHLQSKPTNVQKSVNVNESFNDVSSSSEFQHSSRSTTSYCRSRVSTSSSISQLTPVMPSTARPISNYGRSGSRLSTGISRPSTAQSFLSLNLGDPEANRRELEKIIISLLTESYAARKNDYVLALEKAKTAERREKYLRKLSEETNNDLKFAVLLNLADCYHINKLYEDALATYNIIIKTKHSPNAGKFRVNMGNIYMEQKQYSQAIKMYRMAHDLLVANKEIRDKIMMNIANAFFKMGHYYDVLQSLEAVEDPDEHVLFNIFVCAHLVGDVPKMKNAFQRLVDFDYGLDEDLDFFDTKDVETLHLYPEDSIEVQNIEKKKKLIYYITTCGKLLVSEIEDSVEQGYNWILQTIKDYSCAEIASEIEIEKSLFYLEEFDLQRAEEILHNYEKLYPSRMSKAVIILSFIKLSYGDLEDAEKYAEISLQKNRTPQGLVNLGNCYLYQGNLSASKDLYQEALSIESNCTEALYNLGLILKMMGHYHDALEAFKHLQTFVPADPEAIFQTADVYEILGDDQQALDFYTTLTALVPTDSDVLERMAKLFEKQDDEDQALHYYQESVRYNSSSITALQWIGSYYIKKEKFDKAASVFDKVSEVQPKEIKWKLLVASSIRRSGNYNDALEFYKAIHEQNPDNVDCLRLLIKICSDLGLPDSQEYSKKLVALQTQEIKRSQSISGSQLSLNSTSILSKPRSRSSINSRHTREDFIHAPSLNNAFKTGFDEDITSILPE